MTEEKLSEKLHHFYVTDEGDLSKLISEVESLEAENEAFSKTIDNLIIVNSVALAENQRLQEKAGKWDDFRADFRNHKCMYAVICSEKIDAESRLNEAEKLIAFWRTDKEWFGIYGSIFADELEEALKAR